ncbi:hypothetical protein Barb6_01026 [Bacteroidales bacterium Barb6]|nr:hypothetical protein Barb6XT_01726 [Bacteroidales bacterium Barb6XT]OAV72552.1 hypothetical protein Barb6_01026 [Bacteroidales bacterium Barb6]OAV75473.1 hypothetical protein Barb7_00903 [Bacteroidales bacterium Barb7]
MSVLLKNIGAIILLISVAALAVIYFAGSMSNTALSVGLAAIILGYVIHIVLNKKVE